MEIETLLMRHGAATFAFMAGADRTAIAFSMGDRNIKVTMFIPPANDKKTEQLCRKKWRALLLVIKAKLEAVASGIETIEQAFYANIVMPNGQTIYEATYKQVADVYLGGGNMPLLSDLRDAP